MSILPWACERSSGEVGLEAVYKPRSGRQIQRSQQMAHLSTPQYATERSLIPATRAGPH